MFVASGKMIDPVPGPVVRFGNGVSVVMTHAPAVPLTVSTLARSNDQVTVSIVQMCETPAVGEGVALTVKFVLDVIAVTFAHV